MACPLGERQPAGRYRVLQQNAERLVFAASQLDLVGGGAILHHLRSPARALAECARVLRPGGVAVFFEPFLEGYRIVAGTFEALLARDFFTSQARKSDFREPELRQELLIEGAVILKKSS